ncbi:MAG: hypothetical protein WC998_02830 [Candidatus Paceibacterota bacterium]|jgi:hypothetical protein
MVFDETLGNAILSLVSTAIDAGSAAGDIQFATSDDYTTILATMELNYPSFGSAATKAMALDVDTVLSTTVLAKGTAAFARFRDSNGNAKLSNLTVAASEVNINFSGGVIWDIGGVIYMNSFELTVP